MDKDLEIHSYSMKNPSDWEWTFLLDQKVKFHTLIGNAETDFLIDDVGKILKGFTIKIGNKNGWEAYWEAYEKAKNLTILLSVIYGEFISAYPYSMKSTNKLGTISSSILDNTDPNKPYQELIIDLSNQNITKLLTDKENLEALYHIANALHDSYGNPDSAIRELVLAYGDVENLPPRFKKYHALRHALSHSEVRDSIKKQIQKDFPQSEFSGKKLNKTSSFNRGQLIVEDFFFLHNALSDFRRKFGLVTKTRERET